MSKLTKRQSVALAIYQLGGTVRGIDIEDAAMKAAELTPSYFRWRKYPEQVDLEKVRLCAKNLLATTPPLLRGGVSDGWMLTPEGVVLCESLVGVQVHRGVADGQREFTNSVAWTKYRQMHREEITVQDVRRLLKVDEYTSPARRSRQVAAITNLARLEPQGQEFLDFLLSAFPKEF